MSLEGERAEQLYHLISGHFTAPELGRLARHHLGMRLDAVTAGDSYAETVSDLIAWAERVGCVDALISALQLERPGVPDIQNFGDELGPGRTEQIGLSIPNMSMQPGPDRYGEKLYDLESSLDRLIILIDGDPDLGVAGLRERMIELSDRLGDASARIHALSERVDQMELSFLSQRRMTPVTVITMLSLVLVIVAIVYAMGGRY